MSELENPFKRLNLGKNVRFAVCEFAINATLLFVGYHLLIKKSGLEAVGVWSTLYAWTNLIRLGDAGVSGAAARFLALWDVRHEQARLRDYAETALLTNIVQFSVLSLIAYAALAPSLEHIAGAANLSQAAGVLPWLLLGFFLLNVGGTLQGILQGLHLGYRRSQLSIAGTVIQLAAVLFLVPGQGLKGLAWAQILQHTFITVTGWLLVRHRLNGELIPARFNMAAFRDMLGYSLKAQLVNITNGMVEPISKMLVAHFGGMAGQGLFELAYKTVQMPRNLIVTGVNATTPSIANLSKEHPAQLREVYARSFRLSSRLMFCAALTVIACAPGASLLFLGKVNSVYWLYVALLMLGFFGNVLGATAYVLGMATGQMKNNILAAVLTLVTLVSVGSAGGWLFGVHAVVLIISLVIGLCGVTLFVTNKKLLPGG